MRRMLLAGALLATSAVASAPAAWDAMHRQAAAACIKASGLKSARASAAADFSDASARSVLLVSGVFSQRLLHGASGTMLCLYDRRSRRAEVVEAKGWRARP